MSEVRCCPDCGIRCYADILACPVCDADLVDQEEESLEEMAFDQGELGVFMACHQIMLRLITGDDADLSSFVEKCRDSEAFMEFMLSAQHKMLALLAGTELSKSLNEAHNGFLKIEKTKDGITSQLWKNDEESPRGTDT